jgi:hypothetical protein
LLAFFSPVFFWWVGLLLDGVTVEAQAFKAMASQERLEQLGSKEALKETGSPWFLEKEVLIV